MIQFLTSVCFILHLAGISDLLEFIGRDPDLWPLYDTTLDPLDVFWMDKFCKLNGYGVPELFTM